MPHVSRNHQDYSIKTYCRCAFISHHFRVVFFIVTIAIVLHRHRYGRRWSPEDLETFRIWRANGRRTFPNLTVDLEQRVSFKLFLFPTQLRYTTMLLNSLSCTMDTVIILRALHKNYLTGPVEIRSFIIIVFEQTKRCINRVHDALLWILENLFQLWNIIRIF